jgi:hypothetical protein
MRLGEILVKVGLITREQLTRGLEAQTIHGGRLGTNLVELGFITERQLAGSLSEQLGLPYVSVDMVANIPPPLIAAIPAEVAAEFRVFPIRLKDRVLYVCMASPGNIETVDALAFRLSRSLQPCVVTELTLDYALERYYGIPREPRFITPKRAPVGDAEIVHVADGQCGPSGGVRMSRGDFLSTESGEYFRGGFDGLPRVAPSLAEVKNDDDVVGAMRLFFSAAFPQSVVLALTDATLIPVAEAGLTLDSRMLYSLSIPVSEDCFLRGSPENVTLKWHQALTEPTLALVCEKMGMAADQITVVPVKHSQRIRYVVMGRGLDLPQVRRILPAIRNVAGQVACAFQIVSLRKHLLEGSASCESNWQ